MAVGDGQHHKLKSVLMLPKLYFYSVFNLVILPLVLCLVVAGRLVCPYNPQSCASGSLVPLAGLTMPDWSAEEGPDETTPWSPRLGVRRGASISTP